MHFRISLNSDAKNWTNLETNKVDKVCLLTRQKMQFVMQKLDSFHKSTKFC